MCIVVPLCSCSCSSFLPRLPLAASFSLAHYKPFAGPAKTIGRARPRLKCIPVFVARVSVTVVLLLGDDQPAEGRHRRQRSARGGRRRRRQVAVNGNVRPGGGGGRGGGRLGKAEVPADGVTPVPLQEFSHPFKIELYVMHI